MKIPHNIVRTEVFEGHVIIALRNGVEICLSSNEGYIHLHFSGTTVPMSISACHNINECPKLQTSNLMDISYQPFKKE